MSRWWAWLRVASSNTATRPECWYPYDGFDTIKKFPRLRKQRGVPTGTTQTTYPKLCIHCAFTLGETYGANIATLKNMGESHKYTENTMWTKPRFSLCSLTINSHSIDLFLMGYRLIWNSETEPQIYHIVKAGSPWHPCGAVHCSIHDWIPIWFKLRYNITDPIKYANAFVDFYFVFLTY